MEETYVHMYNSVVLRSHMYKKKASRVEFNYCQSRRSCTPLYYTLGAVRIRRKVTQSNNGVGNYNNYGASGRAFNNRVAGKEAPAASRGAQQPALARQAVGKRWVRFFYNRPSTIALAEKLRVRFRFGRGQTGFHQLRMFTHFLYKLVRTSDRGYRSLLQFDQIFASF